MFGHVVPSTENLATVQRLKRSVVVAAAAAEPSNVFLSTWAHRENKTFDHRGSQAAVHAF